MMEYGTITKQTKLIAGKEISSMTTFTQSVRTTTDDEVKSAFESMINDWKLGKIHNPSLQIEEYSDTGKIKRIIKSWSVYE